MECQTCGSPVIIKPHYNIKDCVVYLASRIRALEERPHDTITLLEDAPKAPPAPPFVLGPKTVAKFALVGSNIEVCELTTRLIAEWLRSGNYAPFTRIAINGIADQIEHGEWGRE